jgi:hypothetical protein
MNWEMQPSSKCLAHCTYLLRPPLQQQQRVSPRVRARARGIGRGLRGIRHHCWPGRLRQHPTHHGPQGQGQGVSPTPAGQVQVRHESNGEGSGRGSRPRYPPRSADTTEEGCELGYAKGRLRLSDGDEASVVVVCTGDKE